MDQATTTTEPTAPSDTTLRDATIGVELSPEMEDYVATVEDICIEPVPVEQGDDPQSRAAWLDALIDSLGHKAEAIAAVEPPAAEAEAARTFIVEPYREAYERIAVHRADLRAAAAEGQDRLLQVVGDLSSELVVESSPERDAWILENGIGDCKV